MSLNFPIILPFMCCANFLSHDALHSQHVNWIWLHPLLISLLVFANSVLVLACLWNAEISILIILPLQGCYHQTLKALFACFMYFSIVISFWLLRPALLFSLYIYQHLPYKTPNSQTKSRMPAKGEATSAHTPHTNTLTHTHTLMHINICLSKLYIRCLKNL